MPGSRISPEELALFNSQLAAIAKSEVPALPGLRALSRDIRGGRLRRVLDRLTSEIESGKPLPEALSAVSENLPPTYTAMIQAGIESRNLPAVLESMTRHYQTTEELKQKVRGALIYPAIIYVLCIVFLFFLSFIILPGLSSLIREFGLSDVLTVPSYILVPIILWSEIGIAALVLLIYLGLKAASLNPAGARFAENFRNSFPIYGSVARNGSLARLSSTLAVLLDAKIPLPKALELTRLAVGSPVLSHALESVSERTSQGAGLAQSLGDTKAFPSTLTWMVSQGEGTNTLAETFSDLAEFYTNETRRRADLAWNATTPLSVAILFAAGSPTIIAFWGLLGSLMAMLSQEG